MTTQEKTLVRNSINEFEIATKTEKEVMRRTVENNLIKHDKAVDAIGVGYADQFVNAGRVFLRITRNYG